MEMATALKTQDNRVLFVLGVPWKPVGFGGAVSLVRVLMETEEEICRMPSGIRGKNRVLIPTLLRTLDKALVV